MADAAFLAMAHGDRPYAPSLLAALAVGSLDSSGMTWIPEVGPHQYRTWADLWDAARRVGAGLRDRGVAPGDRVFIVLDASPRVGRAGGQHLQHRAPCRRTGSGAAAEGGVGPWARQCLGLDAADAMVEAAIIVAGGRMPTLSLVTYRGA
jgi:acyl-CoA synthetase (AMP-forming)/AMP-acid ligase II